MARLLIIPHGKIAKHLAGPGLRALGIARGLSPEIDCSFWAPNAEESEIAGFPVEKSENASTLNGGYDFALVPTLGAMVFKLLPEMKIPVVADLYDPVFFENLFLYQDKTHTEKEYQLWRHQEQLVRTCLHADAFLSCHKGQADYWTGLLTAIGALGFPQFEADPAWGKSLIDLPTGVDIPENPKPEKARPYLGDISADKKIILWGGGIYPWLDPLTPMRALAELKKRSRKEFALLFMGVEHPEGSLAAELVKKTREEAKALDLDATDVHFNEWVPFESRFDVAAACWAALVAHGDHVETRFAFRTRALDAFASGLPLITSGGDFFAALVEHEGAGAVYPCGESGALAECLCNLADRPEVYSGMRSHSHSLGRQFTWREVCSGLRESLLSGAVSRLRPGVRQLQVRQHLLDLSIDESAFGKLARKAAQKGKDLLG